MSLARRVGAGLVWNQASRTIEFGAAYLASVLAARAFGPEVFGVYAIATSIVQVGYAFSSLGLNETLNVHVPRLREAPGQLAFLLRAVLRVRTLIALGFALALVFGAPLFARLWRQPELEPLLRIAGLWAFAWPVSLLLEYYLVGALEIPRVSRVRIAVQLAGLGAAAAALAWRWTPGLLLAAVGAIALAGVAWLLWGARHPLTRAGEPFDLAPLRQFGLTVWVTSFLTFVLGRQTDLLVIGLFHPGSPDSGAYAVAATLAALLASALLMGAEGVSLAAFSDLERRSERSAIGQLWALHLKLDVLLAVPLLAFGGRFAGDIVHTLYGPEFAGAGALLLMYAVAWILTRVTGGGTNMSVLYAMGEARTVLRIYLVSALANLLLALALVPGLGARGAVLATGVAMVGSGSAAAWLVARRTGVGPPLGVAARIIVASVVAALAAGLLPRPAGIAGLAVAGVATAVIGLVLLKWLRPFGEDDRRVLGRLHPRAAMLARWIS